MSHRNPFEIRADMLAMAKDYLDQQWHMNIQLMTDLYEQNKVAYEDVRDAYAPYSLEEMMKKAQELYSFVSKRD